VKQLVLIAVFLEALGASCNRIPEEPTPVTREPTTKTATVKSNPSSTSLAPDANKCPTDPEPSANGTLYDHGTAAFVTPDGKRHEFKMEIARTADAQQRGLMYRTSLAEDAGMVFVFAQPHHASFWMHHTCIALDMVFVSENDKVIGVVTAPPLNDESRSVPGFSKYVVELAAGVAGKRGIAIGTTFVPPAAP